MAPPLRRERVLTFLAFVLAGSFAALRSADDLVPKGAAWRYFKGVEPPPAGWSSVQFDASPWDEGAAGIGFGDKDDATVLNGMLGHYLTVYARRTFELPDPASIRTLVLRLRFDDGFVAYLNGAEVARRGMGDRDSVVSFDTPASESHEAEDFEPFDLSGKLTGLVQGTNVLAIEVHNEALESPDVSLDPQLVANGPAPGGPAGFVLETIADGFRSPVDVAFTPDGRLLVAEKRGVVWVVKDGARLSEPFLNLEDEVNSAGDHGLLGIDVDRAFAQNGRVYLLHVVDPTPGAPDEAAEVATFGRLVRYVAAGDVADTASRKVLLGNSPIDGFIHCHSSHAVGTVRCASDGAVFVGSGDGAHFDFLDAGQDTVATDPGCAATFGAARDTGSLRAQDLDSLAGKVLRLDAETGLGLPDNPFFTGDGSDVRSRVWASGLRNPFRFALGPDMGGRGELFIGDVGWETWEEMNVAHGGENFGWPCYEGALEQAEFQESPLTASVCQGLERSSAIDPLFAWGHSKPGSLGFIGSCAAGVVFYEATSFPEHYRGALFFQDYTRGWIRAAFLDAEGRLLSIEDFANDLERPVDLELDPRTGDLVFASIQAGSIQRIRYSGGGNRAPSLVASAQPAAGLPPLEVRFSSEGTVDPDGDAFTVEWDFGDGAPSVIAESAVHVYETSGEFTATARARDDKGAVSTRSLPIVTRNDPPRAHITSPIDGALFFGGEQFPLRAAASDTEDGEALRFEWVITLKHEEHEHPDWFVSNEREPVFAASSHGDSGERFEYLVRVVVTDSAGLTASDSIRLVPGELVRGHSSPDGGLNLTDAVESLLYLFAGRSLPCVLALDVDANGIVNISDPIRVLTYLFIGGPGPEPPFPDCGVAKNVEGLPCGQGCP